MNANKRYLILSWAVALLVIVPFSAHADGASSDNKPVPVPSSSTTPGALPADILDKIEARVKNKDQDAEMCLGDMYLNGYGVSENKIKAEQLLIEASNQGKNEANVYLLELHSEEITHGSSRQTSLMASYFSQAIMLANRDDAVADNFLGYAYLYGYGILNIAPDISQAIIWFNKGAAQGNGLAQAALASIYAHGLGVKADPARGEGWRQKAGSHTEDCPADMNELAEAIINSNMIYPEAVRSGKEHGSVVLRLPASGGVVSKPVIVTSSGHQDIDAAVVRAATGVNLPAWKNATSAMTYDVTVYANETLADINGYIAGVRSAQVTGLALIKHANDVWSTNPYHSRDNATSLLSFACKDGKSTDVKLESSSGDALVDKINEQAVSTMVCPNVRAKKGSHFQDVPYRMSMSDPWDNLYYSPPTDTPRTPYTVAVRKAIEDSEKIPQHALIVGTTGTGVTAVSFNLRNGRVTHVRVTQSSGDAEIDKAAVQSVLHASMPKTPKQEIGRTIHIKMHVNFLVGSTTPVVIAPAASSAP